MPPAVDTQTAADRDAAATKRLKKREIDRRCQREARQRTKSRIAYLEGLVEELRRKDTSGQVASLMQQVAEVRKERDMFARTLRGIEDSIRGHRSVLGGLPVKREAASPTNGQSEAAPDRERAENASPGSIQTAPEAADEVVRTEVPTNVPSASWIQPNFGSMNANIAGARSQVAAGISSQETNCDCREPPEEAPLVTRTKPDRKWIWRFAHSILDRPPVISSKVLQWEDAHSDDIPIRAVIDGWPAVVARLGGHLPPLWAKLRRIDEVVFGNLDRIERLAILYVMHLLLRSHAEPTSTELKQRIPPWYLPRPSQDLSHPYALDFFTWPGIRERLIFSQHSYCTNHFWLVHNAALKVLWQYDFRDCYSVNIQKGEYQLSYAFEERIKDINAWTMRSDFFRQWPEFYGDIPSLESIASPMDSLTSKEAIRSPTQRSRPAKRRAKETKTQARDEEAMNKAIQRNASPQIDALASQFLPGTIPQPDAWKTQFEGRPADEQSVYLALSQESYLPTLPTASAGIWDMRTPGGSSAQDWLWLQDGLDAGISET